MRCYWEKLGILGPIYGLVGQGVSDREIALRLNLTETAVQGCISWLIHFLECPGRAELVLYASPAQHETWGMHAA
jgi:DNA-binding NarL/FixJ family response regulator